MNAWYSKALAQITSRHASCRRLVQFVWKGIRRNVKQRLRKVRQALRRKRARAWQQLYRVRHRIIAWRARHGGLAAVILLLFLIGGSAPSIPTFQSGLESLLSSEDGLQTLRSLLQAVGSALIGAAAIVTSVVLFSMQVNIERMPHGLFHRLSADGRLLCAFAGSFLLAVLVAALSLIPNRGWMGVAAFGAAWGAVLILFFFLYAYRRALILVSPIQQLEMMAASTHRELKTWARRAERAAPLFANSDHRPSNRGDRVASQHDLQRVAFFQINSHWTNGMRQAVRYAVAFSRRFAEQGDYEVSGAAANAIVSMNTAYVEAKGRTFFTYQFMLENPLTSDNVINDTLEHLRQTARISISRGDEQQIEQTLRGLAALVRVYATIDYNTIGASKTHAHLAATYLTTEVERIIPHNMPDVLMEGARLMGRCADHLLAVEGPDSIRTLVEKLGLIGCCGIAKEDYRPITSTCVQQLARLSFDLLRTRPHRIRFAVERIRDNISLIAKLFLMLPDTPLSSTHSTFLGPYYSATSTEALSAQLVQLVNAAASAEAGDRNARDVICNLDEWADGLYRTEKELLLQAIKQRSQFTFDMIHWISQVTTVLLAASNAKVCDKHTQENLIRHALWLISVLSFIPDDIDTVKFVEAFRVTETLFEAAVDAHNRDCLDVSENIVMLLTSWMFRAGQHHSGWGILEHSIYSLAVLALLWEANSGIAKLKTEISNRLVAGGLPDREVRDQAARDIRGRAASLWREGHWGSSIEHGIARADHEKLKPLLNELADLISPETSGQATSSKFL